ncbi:MAG: FkbM family methyltransferase [Gemmatimonadaceae bacterium]|nr:FkbM family methyltransferase [Gloeobacterales cyanobacterium ES-bin-141]
MSDFLSMLKANGHLDDLHLTVCHVGSRSLDGSGEDSDSDRWQIFAPNLTIYGFEADVDACQKMNLDFEARKANWRERHIPKALWSTVGKSTLHLTRFPACSSLYRPDSDYLKRFSGYAEYTEVVSTVEVETTTLDTFCELEGIDEIDFLQIDVQSGDLDVLKGGAQIIAKSVLSTIIEVEFVPLYKDQPLFGDIDCHLRNSGFDLFDLEPYRVQRTGSPIFSPIHPGQLLWSNAFYFRDLLRSDPGRLMTPERLLKLACIADVLSFPDYTLELLAHLTTEYGSDEKYNFSSLIVEALKQLPELSDRLDSLAIVQKVRSSGHAQSVEHLPPDDVAFSPDKKNQCEYILENLQELNFVAFPDWSQPEEMVYSDLESTLRAVLQHPQRSRMALLVGASSSGREQAEAALAQVYFNLLVSEDLNVEDGPQMLLADKLTSLEWQLLLPRLSLRIQLANESQESVAEAGLENLAICTLAGLQNEFTER